jgi:hypothetical protein
MSSTQNVDECVIRLWRGYVKSRFFVVVDASAPEGLKLIESPLFRPGGGSSVDPEGPAGAAHEQLVESLRREGWRPAGTDADDAWYEQRFVREARRSAEEGECVIRWWRGYVKSRFFVVVDADSPDDRTLIESPLFWSLGKRTLAPEGEIAAAHAQLVESLRRDGWQPAGVGEAWFEHRFAREGRVRAAEEEPAPPTPAETAPPRAETQRKPVRQARAEDRSLRVVAKPTSPAQTPAAAPDPSPTSSPSPQPAKQAPSRSKKQAPARAGAGTTPGQRAARRTAARRRQRSAPRAAVTSRRRARGLRSRHLVAAAAAVGWAVLVAADVGALLLVLTGS